ncbi:MAG: integrase domain-containing protein [Gammaproteobacteria bacterium]|nr:integrase domain-containing protein [Gammaproteobacteria bacterium]
MTPLQWDIQKTLRVNRDGSRTTQYQRKMMAFRFAKDIDGLGFRGLRLRGIGNRHVDKAVNRWKQQGLSHATIMNRLSVIRWLGQKINKPNLGYDSNARFGLNGRSQPRFNRAQRLTVSVTGKATDPYARVSFKLQAAFGLRRSEAMKIQPRWADRGTKLVLKGSWTKGGRPREIPIRTPYQRGVLEEAKRLAGNGSMIPPHKSYKQHLHTWEHETRKAGLSKTHGLRHAYAQTRYYELTGWKSPMQGGPPRDTLNDDQRELDSQARRQIAEELGHARISITYVYLGR